MTRLFGRVASKSRGALANVYEAIHAGDDGGAYTYYFCCETCGACGKHRRGYGHASQDASDHMQFHPKEG